MGTSQNICLPDFSTFSIQNLINIIDSGFAITEKLSNEDIKEITEIAQLLSIDITELCRDVPSMDNPAQGKVIAKDPRHKFPRKSDFDASLDLYDETKSVFDALLRIFDGGNVETDFKTTENISIDNDTEKEENDVRVRGTKRKRSDVLNKKDDKYQCQQCDFETSWSGNLRKHVKAKHVGVRYPCDQCDYKASREDHLKKHKEYKHEGVRYPCDKCDYKGITQNALKVHKESKHQGVCYYCDNCQYKATTPAGLKKHVESIHAGVRYPCDQCDYNGTQNSNLRTHKKIYHQC